MSSRKLLLGLLLGAVVGAQANAHFLWVVGDAPERSKTINVYFGEAAEPDDPDLLNRVAEAKAWALTGRRGEPQELKLKLDDGKLAAELPAQAAGSTVVLRHTYGVIERNDARFLLNYYAKTYPSQLPGTWREVSKQDLLPLEVVPQLDGDQLTLKVLWNGKPAAGSAVVVHGPGLEGVEGDTNESGVFTCQVKQPGLLSIRARVIEKTAGVHQDKKYDESRHYSTVALRVAPAQLKPVSNQWPDLPKEVTSFGAAVLGDHLYVYGGHFGEAHHYSSEGQSNEFLRLNLKDGKKWEQLPSGPKLTGLAMVPHKGKLYRVGGFTAKNSDDEDQSLWSQTDVARFDPQQNKWEALAPLPDGRSSIDAVVLGDTLYVVGGWKLQGDEESVWHETALAMDLSAEKPTWQELPKPGFKRRALSVATVNGKLYALGGMQDARGITTQTAVYDPQSKSWTAGPNLLGSSMDGFGSSAFACDGSLFVTTFSGAIQRLSQDGKKFEYLGQLDQPRFFHRMVPWGKELVIVGGAHMSVGKIAELERLPVAVPAPATAAAGGGN